MYQNKKYYVNSHVIWYSWYSEINFLCRIVKKKIYIYNLGYRINYYLHMY
jgi:hypothetical protein